jgi:hypothetical protein
MYNVLLYQKYIYFNFIVNSGSTRSGYDVPLEEGLRLSQKLQLQKLNEKQPSERDEFEPVEVEIADPISVRYTKESYPKA